MKFYCDPKKDEGNHYDSVVGTLEPVEIDLTRGALQDTIDSSQDNTLDLSDLLGPEGSEAVPTINRGNYFPLGMFSEMEPIEVDQLPPEVDGKKNEYKFEYMFKRHVCSLCGVFAEQMACGARKLVEFSHNTGYANVYH